MIFREIGSAQQRISEYLPSRLLNSFFSSHFCNLRRTLEVKMTIFIYSFLLVTCIYNVAILSRLDKLGEL
jgi:uncharacterized membrane protein